MNDDDIRETIKRQDPLYTRRTISEPSVLPAFTIKLQKHAASFTYTENPITQNSPNSPPQHENNILMNDDDNDNILNSDSSIIDEDMEGQIKASLKKINLFTRRLMVQSTTTRVDNKEMVLLIPAGGAPMYYRCTYRELFDSVRDETMNIDRDDFHLKLKISASNDFNDNVDATSLNDMYEDVEKHACNAVIHLRPRDMRWLEQSSQLPMILVRRHVTIIALGLLKAVIMSDKMMLIVPPGADGLLRLLENHMAEWQKEVVIEDLIVSIPFELHAYEAILTTVKVLQSKELDRVSANAHELLTYFKKGSLLPVSLQEEMRELKNNASEMAVHVSSFRHALDELIDNDDDMALMNLTKLRENPSLYRSPLSHEIRAAHEEVEELLQAYAMDYNTLGAKLEHLRNQIQSAEDLLSLRLDTSQDEILVANTAFSLLAFCIGVGAYLAGIFGMNLDNTITIQPVYGVFAIVWAGSTFVIIILYVTIHFYLRVAGILPRRIKRRKMEKK